MTYIWVMLGLIAVLNLAGIYEGWKIIKGLQDDVEFWKARANKAESELATVRKYENVILT